MWGGEVLGFVCSGEEGAILSFSGSKFPRRFVLSPLLKGSTALVVVSDSCLADALSKWVIFKIDLAY